jgi:hypothetical protein
LSLGAACGADALGGVFGSGVVRGAALGLTGYCAPAFAIWLTVVTECIYAVEPLSNAVFAADRPCIFERE